MSSVDTESTCRHELGQTQNGPYTVSTPHTCQWYLFEVSLHLHNTIEKVSLISEHIHPLVSGQKLDTKDLRTEKAEIKKREPL